MTKRCNCEMKKMNLSLIPASLVFLFFCLFLPVKIQAAGATVYVQLDGTNPVETGSPSAPCHTIEKALKRAVAGTTILVSGTTQTPVTIHNVHGTSRKYIRIKASSTGAVLHGTTVSQTTTLLSIYNCSYLSVEGFRLEHLSSNTTRADVIGIGIYGDSYSTGHIRIKNCDISGIDCSAAYPSVRVSEKELESGSVPLAQGHGILVRSNLGSIKEMSGIEISGCRIHDCRLGNSESLVLNGNITDFKVKNNLIYRNDNIGIDFAGYEERPSVSRNRPRNGTCSGNLVYDISSENNRTYAGSSADGIYVDGGASIRIRDNIVINCDIGIEAASEHKGKRADNIEISNNLILNCSSICGISIGGSGSGNGTARSCVIKNNTIRNCQSAIVLQKTGSYSNQFWHNLVADCGTALEFSDAFYSADSLPDLTENSFSGNAFYQFSYYLSGDDSSRLLKKSFRSQKMRGNPVFLSGSTETQIIQAITDISTDPNSASLQKLIRNFYRLPAGTTNGYHAKQAAQRRTA